LPFVSVSFLCAVARACKLVVTYLFDFVEIRKAVRRVPRSFPVVHGNRC